MKISAEIILLCVSVLCNVCRYCQSWIEPKLLTLVAYLVRLSLLKGPVHGAESLVQISTKTVLVTKSSIWVLVRTLLLYFKFCHCFVFVRHFRFWVTSPSQPLCLRPPPHGSPNGLPTSSRIWTSRAPSLPQSCNLSRRPLATLM